MPLRTSRHGEYSAKKAAATELRPEPPTCQLEPAGNPPSAAGTGPSPGDIAAFMGTAALAPVRAYAGLQSAPTAEQRARLVVDDLPRAGGFGRGTLAVVTATGSGWGDPSAVDSLEYLTGGDVATVSMQYSYLPSWLSYLVDQKRAREAGRELFDAVYDRWSKLPADDRPRLLVVGESLGSFGGDGVQRGVRPAEPHGGRGLRRPAQLQHPVPRVRRRARRRDSRGGARLSRRPDGSVHARSAVGHPAGRSTVGRDLCPLPEARLRSNRLVEPALILTAPDWLREPRADDVVSAVRWIPFVTFWQVTADLPFATGVPAGHGHVYTREYVDAWAPSAAAARLDRRPDGPATPDHRAGRLKPASGVSAPWVPQRADRALALARGPYLAATSLHPMAR